MTSEKYSIQPEDPESYLKNKLETKYLSTKELEIQEKKLESQIFIIDSSNFVPPMTFEFKVHFQDIEMEFSETLIKKGKEPEIAREFLESLEQKGIRADSTIVSNLTISRKNEEIINQANFVAKDYTVFITPYNRDEMNPENHIISIGGLITPVGVIALFHEAAHAQIRESLSTEDQKEHFWSSLFLHGNSGRGARRMLTIALKIERDAWALALKKMKPLIGKREGEGLVTKEVLLNHIHKDCLQSYGEEIARKLRIEIDKIIKE